MMRTILLMAAMLPWWSAALAGDEIPIIPMPARVAVGGGAFTLLPETVVVADAALAKEIKDDLGVATGYAFETAAAGKNNAIVLTREAKLAAELGDEGYRLAVTKRGVAIRAATEAGVFYGMQTLRQLLPPEIYRDEKVGGVAWTIPCVEITDRPRFPWRGMMLDVARHYQPVEFIEKFIDLMALHKLNRLHLHLTDSQAWRVEIRKFPELTEKGSSGSASDKKGQGPPMFYTQEELKGVVDYAKKRHIVVIPEIDIPGHSGAALGVHPEWAAGRSLNLQEGTITAYQAIFTELMKIFPGPWVHVGGDEVRASWTKDEKDLAVIEKHGIAKDNEKIQEWLQERIAEPIRAAGRRPVMWDMSGRWNVEESTIPKDTVVMSWFEVERGLRAAKAGYEVIMNPKKGTYFDYRVQRDDPIPCISLNTLEGCYNWDPLPAGSLDGEAAKRVLGTQGQLWTEQMKTPEIVENKAFPRTCALAEVAWTPQEQRDFSGFEERLNTHYRRLGVLDVNYYRLKKPFTIIETVEIPLAKSREDVKFKAYEWDLGKHITGPGSYRVMLHCDSWFHDVEVRNLAVTADGEILLSLPEARFRVKHEKYDFEVKERDPSAKILLRAEVKKAGKDKRCTFEVCIRKEGE